MEVKVIEKPDLVVAIDIGSTYSGYAWQWRSDFVNNRSHVEFNTNWGCGSYQMHKTSTCILLKNEKKGTANEEDNFEDYKIEAVGQLAEEIYKSSCKDGNDDDKWLFKKFKHVFHMKEFQKDVKVEDQNGRPVFLQIVMAKFIQALKDHFLNNLKKKNHQINTDKTLWVITVPAIWSDKAKAFMREAAEKSGINQNNLLLALEPEAAALCCIHLPAEQRENMNNLGTPGNIFLTADIGGLTADLYAVKVNEDGTLSQACMAQGNLAGGQNVNDAFFQVCHDSFEGQEWKKTFRKATPIEMLDMEEDFEQKKVRIGTSDMRAEHISLSVPYEVRKGIENKTIQLKQAPEVENNFKLKNDTVTFNSAFIRDTLFKEPCQAICKIMMDALKTKELNECKTLVLVGGFVESPIVVEHITKMIKECFPNVTIVVPTSPFQAVLKGAVLFGHDPMIFRSRISRYTYGVGTNSVFKEGIHDPSKKFLNNEDQQYYCRDVLSVHVHKGQSVILKEHQGQMVYYPMYKDQRSVSISVYSSTKVPLKNGDKENSMIVMYTSDEGCQKIGEVKVEMPDTSLGTDRKVMVWMIYGGTELSVIAKDETSGNEARAEITFSNI